MQVTIGKLAATAVGLGYVVLAMVKPAWQPIFLNPYCPFMALALIWLAEYLGELTGMLPSVGVVLDRRSSGIGVTLAGWLILVGTPVLMAMVYATPIDPP